MNAARVRRNVAICALGAQAALAQLVVLRAGLERFGGNEFFIVVSLSAWLVAGAIGAIAFGRLADSAGKSRILAVFGALGTGAGVVVSMLLLRLVSTTSSPGLSLSPLAAAAWVAVASALPSMLSGALFAWLIPIAYQEFGKSLGVVTLFESIGAAAGGFLLGSLAIDLLGTSGLAVISVACGAGVFLLVPPKTMPGRLSAMATVLIMAGAAIIAARMNAAPDGEVVATIENRFGRYSAIRLEDQITIMDGGRPIVDCADTQTPELIATVVHSFAPRARGIFVPGGSASDLAVLSRLPGINVQLVTPNPELHEFTLKMCGQALSGTTRTVTGDPLRMLGRVAASPRVTNSGASGVDAILMDLGKPDTLYRSRMVATNAMQLARRALGPGGTLFVMLGQADVRPTDAEIRVLAGILNSASKSFEHCRMLPIGNWWLVCGSDTESSAEALSNASTMPIERRYATDTFLKDALNPFSMQRIKARLEKARLTTPAPLATMPSTMLDSLLDWAARHHPGAGTAQLPHRNWLIIVMTAFTLTLAGTGPLRPLRGRRRWASAVVMVTGGAGMVTEFGLMWTIAATWGSLHLWLGAVVAAYMAGLGFGAYFARRIFGNSEAWLERAAVSFAAAQGLAIGVVTGLCAGAAAGMSARVGIPLSIIALAACGAAAGASFQFVARRVFTTLDLKAARLVGTLRGIDAVAAAVTSMIAALLLIPIAGTVAVLGSCAAACIAMALHKSR